MEVRDKNEHPLSLKGMLALFSILLLVIFSKLISSDEIDTAQFVQLYGRDLRVWGSSWKSIK